MVYDASFWRERRNWSALTGALTGAATRKDYLAMLRHIEAVRAAGMPDEQIRRAYDEVVRMLPSVPALDALEQTANGSAPAPAAPTVGGAPAPGQSSAPAEATTTSPSG